MKATGPRRRGWGSRLLVGAVLAAALLTGVTVAAAVGHGGSEQGDAAR